MLKYLFIVHYSIKLFQYIVKLVEEENQIVFSLLTGAGRIGNRHGFAGQTFAAHADRVLQIPLQLYGRAEHPLLYALRYIN